MKISFWATILVLIGVGLLCALGTWQLQRLAWKNEIIRKLDVAYAEGSSKPLDIVNIKPEDYSYGRVEGVFMADKALLLGPRTREGKIGNDLIVPLQLKEGILFVDMGWTQMDIEKLKIFALNGQKIDFEGLARLPKWNSFTPDNIPEKNQWFKPDTKAIARAKNLPEAFPFIFYAENSSHQFEDSLPNNKRVYPNNDHLGYALFWFSMVGILIIIYVVRVNYFNNL